MTEPRLSNRTLTRLPAELRGRRRSAPKHERSSDVTRTRGWLVGSLSAGLVFALGLALTPTEQVAAGPSRPISRPHRAELDCTSCHGEERPGPATEAFDPADACVGCHDKQRSTRAPHAKLLAAGRMRCTTCHQIHTAMGGVAFEPGGPAIRWRNGAEKTLDKLDGVGSSYAGAQPASVALVELSACMNCHEPARANDPMAHCALGSRLTPNDVAVCFDEHTPLLVAAGTERAALWELSREAAALEAPSPARETEDEGRWPALALLLGLSLGAGVGGLGLTRTLAARRDRQASARANAPSAAEPGTEADTQTQTSAPAPQLRPAERRRLPTINTATCIGCSACVDACPYDVLELRAYVATVAKPDDCCGLTLCEQRCPNGSLVVIEGELIPELPRLDDDLAAIGAPGIYLAGDVTGLPLIRNAINSGSHAVKSIAASLAREPKRSAELDLVIVGAGPAGISAALEAKQLGLRHVVVEQASAAESIRSFPRGKLVFDQPLGMPMVGELWLAESTKEELLGKWMRIIRHEGLDIREGTRVDGCEHVGTGRLRVLARERETDATLSFDCARVLLACGQRGTPRPLSVDIPDAMVDHIHYNLADARSFAGQRVCVVGLGDVAMEATIGLAHQAGTEVYVSYRGAGFKRGKRRNVDELRRLSAAGRVELIWSSEVAAVERGRVELRTPAGPRTLELDALFVMIGNLPPTQLLDSFGVSRGPSSTD